MTSVVTRVVTRVATAQEEIEVLAIAEGIDSGSSIGSIGSRNAVNVITRCKR